MIFHEMEISDVNSMSPVLRALTRFSHNYGCYPQVIHPEYVQFFCNSSCVLVSRFWCYVYRYTCPDIRSRYPCPRTVSTSSAKGPRALRNRRTAISTAREEGSSEISSVTAMVCRSTTVPRLAKSTCHNRVSWWRRRIVFPAAVTISPPPPKRRVRVTSSTGVHGSLK